MNLTLPSTNRTLQPSWFSVVSSSEEVLSATTMTLELSVTGTCTTGSWNLTITNPGSGGNTGSTGNGTFTVVSESTRAIHRVWPPVGDTYGGDRVYYHRKKLGEYTFGRYKIRCTREYIGKWAQDPRFDQYKYTYMAWKDYNPYAHCAYKEEKVLEKIPNSVDYVMGDR